MKWGRRYKRKCTEFAKNSGHDIELKPLMCNLKNPTLPLLFCDKHTFLQAKSKWNNSFHLNSPQLCTNILFIFIFDAGMIDF